MQKIDYNQYVLFIVNDWIVASYDELNKKINFKRKVYSYNHKKWVEIKREFTMQNIPTKQQVYKYSKCLQKTINDINNAKSYKVYFIQNNIKYTIIVKALNNKHAKRIVKNNNKNSEITYSKQI